jgi:hypothetical protein
MAKKTKKQVKTVVAFILDKSGSMSSCYDAAISGFNEYLQMTKKQNKVGICSFNLTLFDDTIERPIQNVEVHEVPALTQQTYRLGGMTALYDAVVATVEGVHEQVQARKDKPAVLVAIMTDGGENASRQHNEKCLSELIEKYEKEGNWTFVFMGANQDSYASAQKMGISYGNTVNWTADDQGTRGIFASMAVQSQQYANQMVAQAATGGPMNTKSFFAGDGGEKYDTQS